jgi:hypothetical protein
MEFYLAIKKNEVLSFAGKWLKMENITKSEISQPGSESQRLSIFFRKWKTDLK